MPVDDPRAVEVIRRHLDPHPIPRQDPDAEPSHLARDMSEDDVAIVELHPEHGVRERLDDLAFELDLLFLGQLDDPYVRRLGALTGLTQLVLDLRALCERAEPVSRDAREMDEGVLPSVIGSDEPEALLVAEPLHNTSCHKQHLLTLTVLMREVVLPGTAFPHAETARWTGRPVVYTRGSPAVNRWALRPRRRGLPRAVSPAGATRTGRG